MQTHNLAEMKQKYLKQTALSIFPKDKQNIGADQKILNVKQWLIGDTEINLMETQSVSATMLLSQKWPFTLLNQERRTIYAFLAGNDTLAKGKSLSEKNNPKTLLNMSILFKLNGPEQPYVSMLAANALLKSIKNKLQQSNCSLPLHIRWRHDVLIDNLKVGQITVRNASSGDNFYTQLNVEVSVKNIPRNFGAYDFQPTYLQRYMNHNVDLQELAEGILAELAMALTQDRTLDLLKDEIREQYQNSLIYLNEKVTIYDTKYEHIHHTGLFLGVNQVGDAILDSFTQPLKDGTMKFNCEAKDYLNLYKGDY